MFNINYDYLNCFYLFLIECVERKKIYLHYRVDLSFIYRRNLCGTMKERLINECVNCVGSKEYLGFSGSVLAVSISTRLYFIGGRGESSFVLYVKRNKKRPT